MQNKQAAPRIIVFDVGGVLIDWNPEYLYRALIPDENARTYFLNTVCPRSWNAQQDLGLTSYADAIAARVALFPAQEDLIRAYDTRWPEMVRGEIPGTLAIKNALRNAGVPLYAITNYNAEKWKISCKLYPFLADFDGLVVSGEEKIMKPDPAIYRLLCSRFGLEPADCLFIDDVAENVDAAKSVGMSATLFTDAVSLAQTLRNEYHFKIEP